MTYYTEIGEKNMEGEAFSMKQGASPSPRMISRGYRHERDMCFGVPVGTRIWVLLFGLIIVVWGVSQLVGLDFDFWPLVAVVFGLVILVSALRRSSPR
jgi:hypothetical protein